MEFSPSTLPPLPPPKLFMQYLTLRESEWYGMASYRINILDGYWKNCLVTAIAVFWGFAALVNSLPGRKINFTLRLTRKVSFFWKWRQDSFNWRAWRNRIFSTNNFENETDSKRWLDYRQLSFSSQWQSQVIAWRRLLELNVTVAIRMTIFSYQFLSVLGTSHNATISTALRLQYAGVLAMTYKAKLPVFSSQVMAAFQSATFDNKQVRPSALR